MGLSRYIALLALLALSFVSALMFESRMVRWYTVELVVIFIGIIFSIIAVASLLNDETGGWFLATLIFGAALVNGIVLFLIVKSFSLLILAIVVNITGMIFSVLSAADSDDEDLDIETYDVDKGIEDEDDYIEVKPKKTKRKYTKRKTTRKKAAKKKATKRK